MAITKKITTKRKECVHEFIESEQTLRCCICGKYTQLIEIHYQAPFCGDKHVDVMDRSSLTVPMGKVK